MQHAGTSYAIISAAVGSNHVTSALETPVQGLVLCGCAIASERADATHSRAPPRRSAVTVTGGPVKQSQEMISGGRYLSGDQEQRTFAAGKSVEVFVYICYESIDGLKNL